MLFTRLVAAVFVVATFVMPAATLATPAPQGLETAQTLCATPDLSAAEALRVEQILEANRWAREDDKLARRVKVPVVFHIVKSSPYQIVPSDKRLKKFIRGLNKSFRRRGARFSLKQIKSYVDEFGSRCQTDSVEARFKKANAVDPSTTLNIYTCTDDGPIGWSYVPATWAEDHYMHGVVIEGFYALQTTWLEHEIGHFLGLEHTFLNGCSTPNDYVDDTPAQRDGYSGCPVERDTCPALPGLDPVDNFMGYNSNRCRDTFTRGQKVRMLEQVLAFKPTMWALSQ